MEKNTVLAIILSTLVLIVAFVLQGYFSSSRQDIDTQTQESSINPGSDPGRSIDTTDTAAAAPVQEQITETAQTMSPREDEYYQIPSFFDNQASAQPEVFVPLHPPIEITTELFSTVLTNAGGDMVSYKWRDSRKPLDDPNAYVELILSGDNNTSEQTSRAFSIAFGDADTLPVSSNFHVNRISEYSIEFYRDFAAPSPVYGTDGMFRLTKRYDFKPNDFMFELTITLDGGFSVQSFNYAGNAYTLSFGPQIGPEFKRLDGHYDYRRYNVFANGKRRDIKVNELVDSRPSWAAISGKYFAFIAIPYLPQFAMNFSEKSEPGLISASRLNIMRPAVNVSKISDTYRFYLGPKTQEILVNYNTGRNEFGIRDMSLVEVANTRGFWGIFSPLERALKWLLLGIYGIVPNYGIAIILLTLLIKIIFFPLTKKGSEATIRMQALAPRIKEIQDKFKDNPQKLQAEMGNFYKQEGYNPLSGCLPMLLQIPIFISMFSLFNNHFDLRGAGFIPVWIPDLSLPEHIIQFENFRVPIFGWTALRALPFIYVASQLLYGKVTQMPGQQSNKQMKMMLFIMPIVFFFVLYDVPSGLLIYWIFSNVLTLVQQVIINKFIIAKRAAEESTVKENVIAPNTGGGKKKKKKFNP